MPETNPDFSQNNYFALRAGLLVVSEIALLSFILSTGLLAHASWLVHKQGRERFQPLTVLFLFAVFFDMMQAFANILSVKWVFKGRAVDHHTSLLREYRFMVLDC